MLLNVKYTLLKAAFLAVGLVVLNSRYVGAEDAEPEDYTYNVNSGETVEYMNVGNNFDYDTLNVNDGGTANKPTVHEDGTMNVNSGGVANGAVVNNEGVLNIASGGQVNEKAIIKTGGHIETASDGASIENLVIEEGGTFYTTNNNEIASITVSDGTNEKTGSITGGAATNILVNAGSQFDVANGSATNVTVSDGGKFVVNNDAVITNAEISDGAHITAVTTGSSITGITINDGATYELSTGVDISGMVDGNNQAMGSISSGVASGIEVKEGSSLEVVSSTEAKDTKVSGGKLTVKNDGTANNTTITNNGLMELKNGANADGITISGAGVVNAASGSGVNNATLSGADSENMAVFNVEGTAKTTVLNNYSEMNISGTAETTTVNNGAVINVNGTATNTTIQNGGSIVATKSGTNIDDLKIMSGGTYDLSTNITLSNVTVEGTTQGSISDGKAENMLINNGSVLTVNSGDTAMSTTIMNGGTLANNGNATIEGVIIQEGGTYDLTTEASVSGLKDNNGNELGGTIADNTADGMTVTEGSTLTAADGGTIQNSSANGGTIVVEDGTANDVEVTNGGVIVAKTSEATVTNTHIGTGGAYDFSTNANVSATYGDDRLEIIISDKTVSNITIEEGSKISVDSGGGKAESITVDGGTLEVNAGGQALSASVLDGEMNIIGGKADKTSVKNTGVVNAEDTAQLSSTTVTTNGTLNLKLTASADKTTIADNGVLNIYDTASAINTYVDKHGIMNVEMGGIATFSTVAENGTVNVKQQGFVDNITMKSGAVINAESGSKVANLTAEKGSIVNIADGSLLLGILTVDVDADLSGSTIVFSNLFTENASEIDTLTVKGGVHSSFGNKLVNEETDRNRTLVLSNGTYIISDSGLAGTIDVEGWNTIKAEASTVRLETDLVLNDIETTAFSVSEMSTLDVSGTDSNENKITLTGNLINNGTIDMSSSGLSAQDSFTIDGDYVAGSAANIIMDVNPLKGTADNIIINGDVAGSTSIYMKSTSPKVPDGNILFAEAYNNISGGADSFNIWRVEGSPFTWETLFENNKWYTYVSDGDSPTIVPETAAYYGLIDNTFVQTASLGANLRNNIAINEYRKVACKLAKNQRYSNRLCRSARPVFTGWLAPVYSSTTVEAPYNYKASLTGVDGGLDLISDGVAKFGLLASYRTGTYTYDESGETYTLKGEAETTINSYLAGAYVRVDANYWSVLLSGYGGMLDAEVSTEDGVNADTSGTVFGATLDVNFIYKNISGLRIEPGVRISYSSVKLDEINDNAGKVQEFDNASRTEAEAGIRIAQRWEFPEARAEIFIKPAVVQIMNDSGEFELVEERFLESTEDKTLVKVEAGMSFDMIENWSASLAGSYSFGSDYTNMAANLSVIYNF